MTAPVRETYARPVIHHAGPDAVAWLHPQPDGSQTLYVIRPGQPNLIVLGLHLQAPPVSSVPSVPREARDL